MLLFVEKEFCDDVEGGHAKSWPALVYCATFVEIGTTDYIELSVHDNDMESSNGNKPSRIGEAEKDVSATPLIVETIS